MSPCWEHFPHEADMGVRGVGSTLAEAFEQGALAMTAMVTDLSGIQNRERVTIECSAPDEELLFAQWLNAVVYEMATRRMVFGRFSVAIENLQLKAEAWGEPIEPSRHEPAVEVKGATFTGLRVAKEGSQWIAQTVVDI